MAGIPEGVCLKCHKPLFIDTSMGKEQRPFCAECEKLINQNISGMFDRKGKDNKKKGLVFPKVGGEA